MAGEGWVWIGGSKSINQNGKYGQLGVASASNMPGARSAASLWIATRSKRVYLFAGQGYDESASSHGTLNDLWCLEHPPTPAPAASPSSTPTFSPTDAPTSNFRNPDPGDSSLNTIFSRYRHSEFLPAAPNSKRMCSFTML